MKMMKMFISLAILVNLLISAGFAAEVEIMPLKDIKVGMKAIGKTVIIGKKIETFDVEILGILSNNKVNENLLINGNSILVKVSGDVIKRAGGIAAGMSGSPVYVDNKLIGGVSSGWVMTDHTVGLVTPIEEMLEINQYPVLSSVEKTFETVWNLSEPVVINGQTITKIRETEVCVDQAMKGEAIFRKVAADIFVDGLSGKAAENFKSRMKNRNIRIARAARGDVSSAETMSVSPSAFEPGSAIGIQLARGDINLSTLGTLTWRDGNKILMLAHSFLKKGNVGYLMTGAVIHHSFASVQMPFKIGAPTEMLGIITQDREKGLAGEIGRLPEMVPVQIDVIDKDLGITRNINFQIVSDAGVFSMVLESTILQALEGVIDREGDGTALLGISLDCANREGERYSFRRENLFYSRTDIVQSLINELTSLMEMVIESDIEEVMPTRLLLKIEIEKKRKTVAIEKVEVKNSSITSGGILDVDVTLKPFREPVFVRKVKLSIPQDIGKENLVLSVYGLNMRIEDTEAVTDTRESKPARETKADENLPHDFDSAIRNWAASPKNSDLLFQLTVEGDEMKKIKLNGKDQEIQPTNLIVTGRIDTTLTLSED